MVPGKLETERPLGHSLAPSPLNPRDGSKQRFRIPYESLLPVRIQYRVSSPVEHEPSLSASGSFPTPEAAADETRSTREPYNRRPGQSSPTLADQPGHTSAFTDVRVKERDLAFLAPFEYIVKANEMMNAKAKRDSPHKCFQPETAQVFILTGCCQLITLEKNKRK